MLNATQLEVLMHFKQNNFSAEEIRENEIRETHPNLRRGSIYHYDFDREEIVEKGEPHKLGRPIIIMDEHPIERLIKKLSLHVVPLTHLTDNGLFALTVQFRNKNRDALIHQATTINSERIKGYTENLKSGDLERVSSALMKHFDFFHNFQIHAFHQPGDVYSIPWHDEKHMRNFVIVSAAHLKEPHSPVLMMPFESCKAIKAEQPLDKPRPIARRRLEKGEYKGRISLSGLARAQHLVLNSFGLKT